MTLSPNPTTHKFFSPILPLCSSVPIVYVLLKVRDFKFVRPVVPGDRLEIHAEMVRGGAGVYTFDVTISCDGGVRAKGELMFTAVAQDSIYA